MSNAKQEEVEKIARFFNVKPETVEAGLEVRHAATMHEKLAALHKEKKLIIGDGPAIEKQHGLGKLTARERIEKLMDPGSFEELGLWQRPYETGFDIEEGRGRGDGVITGFGSMFAKPISAWAQDAMVLRGTVGTIHAGKIVLLMEKALQARTPIVSIFDSEGIRAEDAVQFPNVYSASSISYLQTLSAGVVPRLALIMGSCSGEMSLLAGLNDFVFMVRNSSFSHLAPPYPNADSAHLGDSWLQASTTGFCDVLAENEDDCIEKCRDLLSYLPAHNMVSTPFIDSGDDPNRREEKLLDIVPLDSKKTYNMYKLISLITDQGNFFEIKRHWARNLITGFARFGGQVAGVIANNPQEKGGCLTLDAADKMSRFVHFCDAFNIPLIWLADTPAFLPAIEEETRGLIRHGARMIQVNSCATVPQITVSVRKHYGGGQLAMPGIGLGGDLCVAWPSFQPGLMGAEGAVAITRHNELSSIADADQRDKLWKQLVMEMQWGLDMGIREGTQAIIDPRDTRSFLIKALRWLHDKKKDLPERRHDNFRM